MTKLFPHANTDCRTFDTDETVLNKRHPASSAVVSACFPAASEHSRDSGVNRPPATEAFSAHLFQLWLWQSWIWAWGNRDPGVWELRTVRTLSTCSLCFYVWHMSFINLGVIFFYKYTLILNLFLKNCPKMAKCIKNNNLINLLINLRYILAPVGLFVPLIYSWPIVIIGAASLFILKDL